eukprot:3289823-Pyramimonas_sp.AAC.1
MPLPTASGGAATPPARSPRAERRKVAGRVGPQPLRRPPPRRQPPAWLGLRRPCVPRGPTRRSGLSAPWGG